eukprot:879459-Lingulodinium_polyedra.AAC.1
MQEQPRVTDLVPQTPPPTSPFWQGMNWLTARNNHFSTTTCLLSPKAAAAAAADHRRRSNQGLRLE